MSKKVVIFILLAMLCFICVNYKILFRNYNNSKIINNDSKNGYILNTTDSKKVFDLGNTIISASDKIATKSGLKDKIYMFFIDLYNNT